MSRPVAFFLLDALRHDYLSESQTPFLWSIAQQGSWIRSVTPGAGFCERAEIFTGASALTTGFFTAIGHAPRRSPYRRYASALRVLSLLGDRVGRRVVRSLAYRKQLKLAPYRIPLDLLDRFALTEDEHDHLEKGGLGVESLFDVLQRHRKSVSWHFTALGRPNGGDRDRLEAFLNSCERPCDLSLVYLAQPDVDGHRFGPTSEEMKNSLRDLDRTMQDVVGKALKRCPELRFCFLGDHGMTEVKSRVDVGGILEAEARKRGLRRGKDYFYFLDSTMARVWAPSHLETMREVLSVGELGRQGRVLTKARADALQIPHSDEVYGHLIWWADEGCLISPDYFHTGEEGVRGMHGYDPSLSDSRGCLTIYDPLEPTSSIEEEGHLRDVCPTLCDLLEVPIPRTCESKSLLGVEKCH